jgi:hypothetical protein
MRASHILNRSAIPYHSAGLTLSAILEPLEDRTIGIDDGGLGEFARFSHAEPGEGHADCSDTHLLFPKVWSVGRRAQ